MEIQSPAFSATTRTLTSLGVGTIGFPTAGNTTLAASATVDLRPLVNRYRSLTIFLKTGGTSTGTAVIQLFDGSVANVLATAAAAGGTAQVLDGQGTNPVGLQIKNNDAAITGTYMYCGVDLIQ